MRHEEEPFEINLWLAAAIVILSLVLSAFFAGAETAFTAASRARMLALENDGDLRAAIVNRLLGQRERFIGAMLIGYNVVAIGASSLHDERPHRPVRARRRHLRDDRDVAPRHHLRRGDAEDDRDHIAGPHVAPASPSRCLDGRAVRASDARRREARARLAAAVRHPPRRASIRALGRGGNPRPGRPPAQGGRRSPTPSATCSAASSTCATSPSPT